MEWTPAFSRVYRERAFELGIDLERSYQELLTSILGEEAQAVHEHSMVERPLRLSMPALTPAEVLAAEQLSYGYTLPETALVLGKSFFTIQAQVRSAQRRLGASNASHMVALAIRSGQVLHLGKKKTPAPESEGLALATPVRA